MGDREGEPDFYESMARFTPTGLFNVGETR
jgi:hypothetical protein